VPPPEPSDSADCEDVDLARQHASRGQAVPRRVKRPLVLHTLLFAVYPVAYLYSHNAWEVRTNQVIVPGFVVLATAGVCWALLTRLVGDAAKAGLVVSGSWLLFFFYGPVRELTGPEWSSLVSSSWVAIFVLWTTLTLKARGDLRASTRTANVIAILLTVLVLVDLAWFGWQSLSDHTVWLDGSELVSQLDPLAADVLPDIYFIVLDGYGRADVLDELYGHDNRGFLEFLVKRGFFIAEQSSANYPTTVLSLSSCLNLAYLEFENPESAGAKPDLDQLDALIKDSRAQRFLRRCGYTSIAFETGFPSTEIETADVVVDTGRRIDSFLVMLLNMTPVPEFVGRDWSWNPFNIHRNRIRFVLDGVADAPALAPAPRFVFAHIYAPHPPFVLGPDGEERFPTVRFNNLDGSWIIRTGGLTTEQYVQGYRDQTVFVNARLREAVDAILERSETPPIILLVGDHGPRSSMVWDDLDQTDYRKALSNLCAVHLPGEGAADAYAELSLVNLFRIVFDRYHGTQLGLLDDRVVIPAPQRSHRVEAVR
jgi:hypothetical protein